MEKKSSLYKWAILLTITGCSGMGGVVSPIVQKMVEHYPDVAVSTIRLVSTIPSLTGMIFGLLVSMVIGKKVKYKTVMTFGAVMASCGILPFFFNSNFTMILFSRFLFGLGFGSFNSRNAIIHKIYKEESAKWMGFGIFVVDVVSVGAQLLSGIIGDINWKYSFLLYLWPVIVMFIIIFLFKEPDHDVVVEDQQTVKIKEKLDLRVFVYFFTIMALTLCLYPFLSSISMFVAERGLGGATQSGWCSSAYTLGGAALGLIFGQFVAKLKRFSFAAGCGIVIIGYVATLSAYTGPFLCVIGGLCCGSGFTALMMLAFKWAGDVSGEGTRALASTIVACSVSCGSFFSTYFMMFAKKVGSMIPLFETEIEKTFLFGILMYGIVMVFTLIKDPRPEQSR